MEISLEYPISKEVRYRQAHSGLRALLETGRDRYAARLKTFIDVPPVQPDNGWFPPQDMVALTGMIQTCKPSLYLEIGSGWSTKTARRAVNLYSPQTRIVSIDPSPRADIDAMCDEVIRTPMESVPLSVFDRLTSGDFLFVDGSHYCFMNSDVTAIFLDVLPRLRSGVFVHFHDIFWPMDYPASWSNRHYNEQYLLACYLLAGDRLQVELPNAFMGANGSSFWVSIR